MHVTCVRLGEARLPSHDNRRDGHSYRLIENWTQLPLGEMFGKVSAVATDSHDQVYVFQRKDPPVVVFDRDGIFYLSEGEVNGLAPRISLMDKHATVVARWDSLSAHGSWVDAHGDIYLALGARARVDK
jgi:hypothetical protein